MRKYLLVTLLVAVLLPLFTQAQNAFTVKGKISEKRHPQKAYLLYTLYGQQKQIIDSSVIKNGKFMFKGTVTDPVVAVMKIRYQGDTGSPTAEPVTTQAEFQRGILNITSSSCLNDKFMVMLGSGEVSLVAADSVMHATITGPKLSTDFFEIGKILEPMGWAWIHLQKDQYEAQQLPRGTARTRAVAIVADSLSYVLEKWGSDEDKFVQSHTDSYAGLYFFNDLLNNMILRYKVDSPKEYFEKFSPEVRATQLGQELATKFGPAKLAGTDTRFADFTQPDINGKPFSLSSLKGKYVLIDLWASWCKPCRAEMPNLVKAYHALKGKNLEIVGVSLDSDGKAWRDAVKQDGISWIQVSDLQGANNALAAKLGVKIIPQNFLLDPNGVIIGTNIRGESTEKQLAKLMKVE